jgi:hypothetical protein
VAHERQCDQRRQDEPAVVQPDVNARHPPEGPRWRA